MTRSDGVSCLRFDQPADFWELSHLICKAERVDAVQQLVINALIKDATRKIPGGFGSSVVGGIPVETEGADEDVGTSEVEQATAGARQSRLVGVSDSADISGPGEIRDVAAAE